MREPVTVQGVGTILPDVPDLIFDAVTASFADYDDGGADITTTSLIAPPQPVHLQRTRWEDLRLGASRFLYRLWGTQVHKRYEAGGEGSSALIEARFFKEVLGWKVGGQIDHYEGGILTDLKTLSAYEGKRHASPKTAKPEKVQQANVNAHLLRCNGLEVHTLKIDGIVRDWRPSESRREEGYPAQAISFDLPVWEDAECARFIEERVRLHQRAREGDVKECTAGERWIRNGRPVRCHDYCDVSSVCPQHAAHLNPQA